MNSEFSIIWASSHYFDRLQNNKLAVTCGLQTSYLTGVCNGSSSTFGGLFGPAAGPAASPAADSAAALLNQTIAGIFGTLGTGTVSTVRLRPSRNCGPCYCLLVQTAKVPPRAWKCLHSLLLACLTYLHAGLLQHLHPGDFKLFLCQAPSTAPGSSATPVVSTGGLAPKQANAAPALTVPNPGSPPSNRSGPVSGSVQANGQPVIYPIGYGFF